MYWCTYLLVSQSKLEQSLSCIDADDSGPGFPVEAEELILDNPSGIDGVVKGANGTSISSGKAILDMVKCGVNKEIGAGST